MMPLHTPTTDPTLQQQQALHVTTISVASFIGRLVTGFLADNFSKPFTLPKFLAIPLLMWKHLLAGTSPNSTLQSSSAIQMQISRSFWAFSSPGIMLIASLMGLGMTGLEELFWVSIVVGVAYGGMFVVVPMLINEYFGSKRFGVHWYVFCSVL
jgi:MFS family permease